MSWPTECQLVLSVLSHPRCSNRAGAAQAWSREPVKNPTVTRGFTHHTCHHTHTVTYTYLRITFTSKCKVKNMYKCVWGHKIWQISHFCSYSSSPYQSQNRWSALSLKLSDRNQSSVWRAESCCSAPDALLSYSFWVPGNLSAKQTNHCRISSSMSIYVHLGHSTNSTLHQQNSLDRMRIWLRAQNTPWHHGWLTSVQQKPLIFTKRLGQNGQSTRTIKD